MNFIKKHKLMLATIPICGATVFLLNNRDENEKKYLANINIDDIRKDIKTLGKDEQRFIDECCVYAIARPFPGQGYDQWLRTERARYYLHRHHKIAKMWYHHKG